MVVNCGYSNLLPEGEIKCIRKLSQSASIRSTVSAIPPIDPHELTDFFHYLYCTAAIIAIIMIKLNLFCFQKYACLIPAYLAIASGEFKALYRHKKTSHTDAEISGYVALRKMHFCTLSSSYLIYIFSLQFDIWIRCKNSSLLREV
jgi:hypothetical protein